MCRNKSLRKDKNFDHSKYRILNRFTLHIKDKEIRDKLVM